MKKIIALSITVYFLVSCNLFTVKPRTEEFYCKIIGKDFRPKAQFNNSIKLQLRWDEGIGFLSLLASNLQYSMFMSVKYDDKLLKVGKNIILGNPRGTGVSFNPNVKSVGLLDYPAMVGEIEITKINGYLVSGTFSYEVLDTNTKINYKVTNGQFNNLSYYNQ